MLGIFKITLRAVEESNLTPNTAELLHGLYFLLLERRSKELAKNFHFTDQKPFTLSPLFAKYTGKEGRLTLEKHHNAWFNFTALTEEATQTASIWMECHSSRTEISLSNGRFRIISVRPGNLPESADYRLVDDISQLSAGPNWSGKTWFRFKTPAAFKMGENVYTLPDPGLVFSSLSRKWKFMIGNSVPEVLNEDWRKCIRTVQHQIRTKVYYLSKGEVPGFTGKCLFEVVPGAPKEIRDFASKLVSFAPFCGVGMKTALGMGQVETRSLKKNNENG